VGEEAHLPFVKVAFTEVPQARRDLGNINVFVGGYLNRPLSRKSLRAGHQVVSIDGIMPTATVGGSGPAGGCAAIAILSSDGDLSKTIVRTLCRDELLRLWELEGMAKLQHLTVLQQRGVRWNHNDTVSQ
jgi:hypothetical protein